MFDCIVAGGGPAGSTAAAILAKNGRSVLLLERERFPRFQIGESLLPFSNPVFDRIGVRGDLDAALAAGEFMPKRGAIFTTGDGKPTYMFRFDRNFSGDLAQAFQVKRSLFDAILLKAAARQGADVRQESTVHEVDLSDPFRAVVKVSSRDGGIETVEARHFIDATGHHALLGSRMSQRLEHPALRKIALFAHYRGVTPSAPDDNAGSTVVAVIRDGWFWMIPVDRETMSVGLVIGRDDFQLSALRPEQMLERMIALTPYVADRMTHAERIGPVYARKDFSFSVRETTGANFTMIGDAAGFIDPIFSTGVLLAMKTAEIAADAIEQKLETGATAPLARYAVTQRKVFAKYLDLIERFYDRSFLEVFLQPHERFGILSVIVRMLAGDVFEKAPGGWKLQLLFALVKLQRLSSAIAPGIAWDTLPHALQATEDPVV